MKINLQMCSLLLPFSFFLNLSLHLSSCSFVSLSIALSFSLSATLHVLAALHHKTTRCVCGCTCTCGCTCRCRRKCKSVVTLVCICACVHCCGLIIHNSIQVGVCVCSKLYMYITSTVQLLYKVQIQSPQVPMRCTQT